MKSKRTNQNKAERPNIVEHASEFLPVHGDMPLAQEKNESETLLAQWQTCVEMANSVSQRRDTMNNLFITINSGIMAFASFTFEPKTFFTFLAGILICILWIIFIRNYKELNTAKFKIIHDLEQQLPTSPFKDEWNIIKMRGKYVNSTSLEYWLPGTFLVIYVVFSITLFFLKYIAK